MSQQTAREDALKASKDFPRGKAIAYCIKMARVFDGMDKPIEAIEYKQRAFAIMQEPQTRVRSSEVQYAR